MNVREVLLVPLVAVVLVGVPLAGFVLEEDADRVSARTTAPVEDPRDEAGSEDDAAGKAKGKTKDKAEEKGRPKAGKPDKSAEKRADKAAAEAEHAAAMKAWARCVATAMSTPGPDKPKPWRACPQKPLGPGRAAHEKEKPAPPGHTKQAGR